jgi:hypothetical protein
MNKTFHRNLNGGEHKWSVVVNGKATKCFSVYACDVTVKQPSGKKFDSCIAGGKRGVFAWFKSESVQPDFQSEIPSSALRVFFNPKKGDTFFKTSDGVRLDYAAQIWCTTSGECYAVR